MKYAIPFIAALAIATPLGAEVSVTTIVDEIEASGGVSMGPDGHVYVADFGATLQQAGGRNVYRIAPDGSSVEVLNDQFGGASGNAFGTDGHLYQSDVARGEAHRIAMDGTRTLIAAEMASPVGIAPNADGSAYVTNCTVNRILRIDADGTTAIAAEGAPLNCPNGLAFGGDGALYTVNFRDETMVRIDPATGEMQAVAQIPGGGNGHLSWANDRFYIASFRGGRIYSVVPGGAICHIAGSGEAGNADGDGPGASFFRPNGAAVSADGDSFYTNTIHVIADGGNPGLHPNAVRRIDGLLSMLDCPDDRIVGRAAGDRVADEAQLRHIKTQVWPGYYRNQDVEGLSAYLGPGFVNIAPDGSASEREAEIAWVAANEWNPTNFRYVVDRIDWFGPDLVMVTGRGLSERTDEQGRPCDHSYASTNMVRRAQESPVGWHALASHVSGTQCVVRED